MSISSGLLGLWQEVARSDSWATESRSARCAEAWTAEAGEGQLARLGAGCSGGRVGCRKAQRSTARVALSRGCAHGSQRSNAATQQRSNAAQAVHGRGGRGGRRGLRELLWRRGTTKHVFSQTQSFVELPLGGSRRSCRAAVRWRCPGSPRRLVVGYIGGLEPPFGRARSKGSLSPHQHQPHSPALLETRGCNAWTSCPRRPATILN
jgi:hypothetical protein